jgi:predicted membrane channel-forming protein YqfA (hemolysin III family)
MYGVAILLLIVATMTTLAFVLLASYGSVLSSLI